MGDAERDAEEALVPVQPLQEGAAQSGGARAGEVEPTMRPASAELAVMVWFAALEAKLVACGCTKREAHMLARCGIRWKV